MSGDFPNITPSDRRLVGLPIIGFPSALTPILQFNATLNSFEWVSGGSVSEVEFLQGKSADGKLRNITGERTTTGVIISITPPNGVTTVIYAAMVTYQGGANGTATVELTNDGVVIEQCRISNVTGAPGQQVKFITKGTQLVGDGIKTITLTIGNESGTYTIKGNLEAYDL